MWTSTGLPSLRTDLPIPRALEDLILSCLAKEPAKRPQSARALSLRLSELEGAKAWTQDDARQWWEAHRPDAARRPATEEGTGPATPDVWAGRSGTMSVVRLPNGGLS